MDVGGLLQPEHLEQTGHAPLPVGAIPSAGGRAELASGCRLPAWAARASACASIGSGRTRSARAVICSRVTSGWALSSRDLHLDPGLERAGPHRVPGRVCAGRLEIPGHPALAVPDAVGGRHSAGKPESHQESIDRVAHEQSRPGAPCAVSHEPLLFDELLDASGLSIMAA